MQNDSSLIQIELTPRFQRDLRALAKRYRQIRSDLQPLIEQLQAGELPGDRPIRKANSTTKRPYLNKRSPKKNRDDKTHSRSLFQLLYQMSDRLLDLTHLRLCSPDFTLCFGLPNYRELLWL